MISPRTSKVLRDLWLNLPRTLLVVLAISIGIFGIGLVINTSAILTREIDQNYALLKPASATLWTDRVDEGVLATARQYPGVLEAEAIRSSVRARVRTGTDTWEVMRLFVVDDISALRINRLFLESGSAPTSDDQILVERGSQTYLKTSDSQKIEIQVIGSTVQTVTIAGTVFEPGQDPAWVNNITFGYITSATLARLGGTLVGQGLNIVVSDQLDRSQVLEITRELTSSLSAQGVNVLRSEVPVPGEHPQSEKINSILLLLELFGLVSLVLSGFMAATLISALLSQQVRQIGVMKALGANTRQIMGLYLGMVLLISIAALLIGLPLAAIAGQAFAVPALTLLNFNIISSAVPHWAFSMQVLLGLLIPLLSALYPIYRGSRITVKEAVNDQGITTTQVGARRSGQFLGKLFGRSRLLALAIRNVFRRRGRLLLVLVMLAAGTAAFIAALSSAASWNTTIDRSFAAANYDIDVRLGQAYQADAVENSIRDVPGVADVEAWGYSMANSVVLYSDGTYSGPAVLFAPPNGSVLVQPVMMSGRWLQPGDMDSIVVDNDLVDKARKLGMPLQMGDVITYVVNGQNTVWQVVGIMDKIGIQSASYVNYDYFSSIINQKGNASALKVVVEGHDKSLQKSVAAALEQKLTSDGFSVFAVQDLSQARRVMVNHVVLILFFLLMMAILTALVGTLGLASTMSVNVYERGREIGILRSLGASSGSILSTVIIEGVAVSIIGWLMGWVLSVPLTDYLARNTGKFIFPQAMQVVMPLWIPFLYLGIVVAAAAVASLVPAWNATRLTVREVLSYE